MGLFDGTSLERPVTCDACGKALARCACPRDAAGDLCTPKHQDARVRRDKRRGKWTTVVAGLDPQATDLKALTRQLKAKHAAGTPSPAAARTSAAAGAAVSIESVNEVAPANSACGPKSLIVTCVLILRLNEKTYPPMCVIVTKPCTGCSGCLTVSDWVMIWSRWWALNHGRRAGRIDPAGLSMRQG